MVGSRIRKFVPSNTQMVALKAVATGKVYISNQSVPDSREIRQPTYVALLRAKMIQPNGNVRYVTKDSRSMRRVDLTKYGRKAMGV